MDGDIVILRTVDTVLCLGRSRHRWEEHFKRDLKEIGVNMRNWNDSAQDKDYWELL